ncbi:MAG: hypothetical protein V3U94_03665, partial [Candidatus Thorarchaeota archaeon]
MKKKMKRKGKKVDFWPATEETGGKKTTKRQTEIERLQRMYRSDYIKMKAGPTLAYSGSVESIADSIRKLGGEVPNMTRRRNKMKKSSIALVIVPGELSKAAAKLSAVSAAHPAGLSGVQGKTRSKIPYTSHVERMKLAKMAAERMLLPRPEGTGEHSDTAVV